jgi:hypothetical protein
MMTGKFMKDKKTGLVVDVSADYNTYLLEKKKAKSLVETKQELKETKNKLSSVEIELSEKKDYYNN